MVRGFLIEHDTIYTCTLSGRGVGLKFEVHGSRRVHHFVVTRARMPKMARTRGIADSVRARII